MKWLQREPLLKYKKTDNIVTKLLKIRGISDEQEFLKPTQKSLNDPYLLRNIEEVANRIIEAIVKNEKVCISADCDSDGLFSTAFMYRYLSQYLPKITISYNQRSQGHGVENQIEMIPEDTQLLIVLDSSTNSTEACYSLSSTMDIVILDHHAFEQENPYAVIVNPQLDDSPNKSLSGAGVVYKVLQVVDNTIGSGTVDDYIDLVACGMYADMMDVSVLENRYLIIEGMKNIRNTGLLAILDVNKVSVDKVDSQTIGFTISPLINGVARMDMIELAINLLICDDFQTCVFLVNEMKEVNERRKQIEKDLFEKHVAKLNPDDKIIISIDEVESKGFNGLIANKISNEFQRPSLVMRDHNGSIAGSYRSYGNFPMDQFLKDKRVKKYLQYSVGHPFAGGVGLKTENLDKFKKVVNDILAEHEFETRIDYDIELDSSEITQQLVKDIEKFDYLTGTGFPTSSILVKGLFVEDNPKVLGKTKETVKIKCDSLDVLKFKVNEDWASEVGVLDSIDVTGQLKLNSWTNWRGETTVICQVIAEDYRLS